MLAHLHGHFVGADLLYDDEYAALGMSPLFAFVTDEGVVSNHWPAGATWVQAPGYGLGLLAGRVLAAVDVAKHNALGVVPLLGVRAWALVVLAGCAFAIARWFARAGGSRVAGLVGAACVVFGTPLWYYAAEAPLRPHLWGFAVCLGFVALWRSDLGTPTARAVALGALAGLATVIRPQLGVLVLLVVHDVIIGGKEGRGRRLGLAGLAFVAWPLIHLRLQLWMYGPELLAYSRGVSHHVAAFLASPYHGALTWCPVLGLGLAAVVGAAVTKQRGAVLIVAIVLHQIWLDSGMRDIEAYRVLGTRTWAGGVAFGPRKLVDVLPLFLPAALWLVGWAKERGRLAILAAGALALCTPTLILHLAAFVAPDRTTGTILDGRGLVETMGVVLDGAAWSAALQQRALPLLVGFVVGGLVALPLAVGLGRLVDGARRLDPVAGVRLAAAGILGVAVLAHIWSTVLQVRSDAALIDEPERMRIARERLHPVHEATVSRIPAHHATLKAILGDGAAP